MRYALEDYTIGRLAKELEEQKALFEQLGFDYFPVFAYPCGMTWVESEEHSYVPLIASMFEAARDYDDNYADAYIDPGTVDIFLVPSFVTDNRDAAYLINIAEQALKQGKWAVFAFHGIEEGWLITRLSEFEPLLAYLQDKKNEIWTAPFGEAASYIKEQRQ